MSYLINGKFYKKKDEITALARSIRDRNVINEFITGEDYNFLVALFENHNEWDERKTRGFHGITTGKATQGTTCFYLKTDSGLEDISFIHAVKCMKKTQA